MNDLTIREKIVWGISLGLFTLTLFLLVGVIFR